MKRFPVILSCVVVLLVAVWPDAARAVVVYDNTVGTFYGAYNPGTAEVGDEVFLQGMTSYTLSEFSFLYSATGLDAGAQVDLTLYENDGTVIGGLASPGTVIWQHLNFGISSTASSSQYVPVIYDTTDFGTSLVIPDHFTWSVRFHGLGTGSVALPDLSYPNPGLNYDTYWEDSGTGWDLFQIGTTPSSFGAVISAVPEPSAIWGPAIIATVVILARGISRRRQKPVAVLDVN